MTDSARRVRFYDAGYQKVNAQKESTPESIKMLTDKSVIRALDRKFSRDVTVSTTVLALSVGVDGGVRRTS